MPVALGDILYFSAGAPVHLCVIFGKCGQPHLSAGMLERTSGTAAASALSPSDPRWQTKLGVDSHLRGIIAPRFASLSRFLQFWFIFHWCPFYISCSSSAQTIQLSYWSVAKLGDHPQPIREYQYYFSAVFYTGFVMCGETAVSNYQNQNKILNISNVISYF